jgi:MFS family permease
MILRRPSSYLRFVIPFIAALTILLFFIARESPFKDVKAKLDYIGAVWLGIALAMVAFLAISYEVESPSPSGFGFDILTTGLYVLPLAIAILVVAYPIGILISKYGVKSFLVIGSILGIMGFLFLSTATTAVQIAEYLVVAAAGLGVLQVATQNLLVLSVNPHEMGLATSLNGVFRNLGASIGAPISGSMLSTFTATYLIHGLSISLPARAAFQYPFYFATIGFVVVLALSFLTKEVIDHKNAASSLAKHQRFW